MKKTTAEEIKSKFTCRSVMIARGVTVVSAGPNEEKCLCPFHKDTTPSMNLSKKEDVWVCRAGCGGGDVVRLLAMLNGQTDAQYLAKASENGLNSSANAHSRHISSQNDTNPFDGEKEHAKQEQEPKGKIVKAYDYHDADGKLVYQSVRYDPKGFSQRRVMPDGSFLGKMKDVQLFPYQLPKIKESKNVWIVEGEKDADTITVLGQVATCNVGGATKWLDSYSEHFAGKDVVICGDNDKAGEAHVEKVTEALRNVVKSLCRVRVPLPSKDISEYLEGMSDSEAQDAITVLWNEGTKLYQGETLPIKSMSGIEETYNKSRRIDRSRALRLGRWLPSFSEMELLPGDLFMILAETGVGKTAILTDIAFTNSELRTIFFEQELAETKMFERSAQRILKISRKKVQDIYDRNERCDWRETGLANNILFCDEAGLTLKRIDSIVRRSDQIFGAPPDMILIDYIQLMRGEQKQGRYEMFSEIAEGLKLIAKNRKIVIGCASQVNRDKERGYGKMNLNDAKESGSIENSSTLVLGASRNPENNKEMCIQVLKATEYGAGRKVMCTYNTETLQITENLNA